jgi:hypothetical protein
MSTELLSIATEKARTNLVHEESIEIDPSPSFPLASTRRMLGMFEESF